MTTVQLSPVGITTYDRLHKIRPLLTKMNANFHKQAVSSTSQSIDEAMIRFKGRASFRQYMPMKPIKRGFKVWVRADAKTRYVYQFQLYTGKDDGDGAGLASRVVKHLTNSLKNTSTHVAFDNFFSSVKLLDELHADCGQDICHWNSACKPPGIAHYGKGEDTNGQRCIKVVDA